MGSLEGADGLERRLRALGKTPRLILGRSALRMVREAKLDLRAHHTKTAGTERSIRLGVVTDTTAEVRGSVVAVFIDRGTKPHLIRPRKRRALRWANTAAGRRLSGTPRTSTQRGENGGVSFARLVRHPGTSADPFLTRSAAKAIAAEGADSIIAAWNEGD